MLADNKAWLITFTLLPKRLDLTLSGSVDPSRHMAGLEKVVADQDKIVAVGLLTEFDLSVLGQGFARAYPIEDHHDFDELLRAIDDVTAHRASPELGRKMYGRR